MFFSEPPYSLNKVFFTSEVTCIAIQFLRGAKIGQYSKNPNRILETKKIATFALRTKYRFA